MTLLSEIRPSFRENDWKMGQKRAQNQHFRYHRGVETVKVRPKLLLLEMRWTEKCL